MNKTRRIINDNIERFPEFQYYHGIIDEIEENLKRKPDTAIESCKALFEGMSKTILIKFGKSFVEKGRSADSAKQLTMMALNELNKSCEYDQDIVSHVCKVIDRMNFIRNNNGDISHGKRSPKVTESDLLLADYLKNITDCTAHYMLTKFFNIDFSYKDDLEYEDNEEFNNFLDEEHPLVGIVLYSKALFEQDLISYKEQLNDFLMNKNEENI